MEVHRNEKPKYGFLRKVREIATKNKIVLIFDECTSGFRVLLVDYIKSTKSILICVFLERL